MIPITKPQLGKEELNAVKEVFDSGWLVHNKKAEAFEKELFDYLGVKYVSVNNSCTSSLHMALLALGIGPGDQVIIPAFTWVATANVVELVGARPIFVDIELETFTIDGYLPFAAQEHNIKAIIPVHLFGLSADMEDAMENCRINNVQVVEDAACALGTKFNGKPVGTIGDVGCFSFYPRKIITTGEGGALVTNNEGIYKKAVSLKDHGAPNFDFPAFNYRMTDIQAAIGLEQMKKLNKIIEQRQEKAKIYNKAFKDNPYFKIPFVPEYSNHTYQSYVLLLRPFISRDMVARELARHGIATTTGTQCVPLLPYYKNKYGFKEDDFPYASYAAKSCLTLPLYPDMTKQQFIIKKINEITKEIKGGNNDFKKSWLGKI